MESFYKILKGDLIRGKRYFNEGELRKDLKGNVNYFYNTLRLHLSLGYLSPMEYVAMVA